VYEKHYGPIPEGYQIHHIDGNHENDDPKNLMAVTPEEHARLHIESGTMYRGADPTTWISGASEAGKLGGKKLWESIPVEDRSKIMKERGKNSSRFAGKKTSVEKKAILKQKMLEKPLWTCTCGKVMRLLQGNIKQHKTKCKAW
jgi:hypothetical protein